MNTLKMNLKQRHLTLSAYTVGCLGFSLALLFAAPTNNGQAAPSVAHGAAIIETINILQNAGFEITATATLSQTGTAGWQAWWKEEPDPNDGSFNYAYRPKWNRESLTTGAAPELVYAEKSAQRVFNNWDPWYGGVQQTVTAAPGTPITLTANARLWASSDAWPNPSDTSVNAEVQVGLDPTGGTDPFSPTVIWSAPISPHNAWQMVSVPAVVGVGGRVTAFLSTDYRGYSRNNLMVFWDAVTLRVPVVAHFYLPMLVFKR